MLDALHVGPILLGTDQPAHILTPSVTSRGIVNMTALAVVEASHKAQATAVLPADRVRDPTAPRICHIVKRRLTSPRQTGSRDSAWREARSEGG